MSRADDLEAFLGATPFAGLIGMRCDIHGDEMTAVMPFQDRLIGNAALPALHGGALGAFLEMTAMAQVFLASDLSRPPKPIDLTVDYLRPAGPQDTYARASIRKLGRRMTAIHAEAWQQDRAKPVAALRAQFLVEVREGG